MEQPLADDKTMRYHEMAAFIFLLFLVAKDRQTGSLFANFEEQLKSVPDDMPFPYRDFHRILLNVRQAVVVGGGPRRAKYLELFNNAHTAIKKLLDEMKADALWDVCLPTDLEKIKSIALQSLMDLNTRPQSEQHLSQLEKLLSEQRA
jgi:hypothetical protein